MKTKAKMISALDASFGLRWRLFVSWSGTAFFRGGIFCLPCELTVPAFYRGRCATEPPGEGVQLGQVPAGGK